MKEMIVFLKVLVLPLVPLIFHSKILDLNRLCWSRFQEIMEVAEDMAIDIPHIFLYLAELITPMLHEGGIPMGELFKLAPGHICI